MEIIKAYKVRIYPNNKQATALYKTIGACRWIWNQYLEARIEAYARYKEKVSYEETSKDFTQIRKQTPWLQEVRFEPLQQTLRKLDNAYKNFFSGKANFPKFKSKYNPNQSFQKITGWKLQGNYLHIQRGLVIKVRGEIPLQGFKTGNLTISIKNNKWWASMLIYEQVELPTVYSNPIGIDMGLNHLAITNEGKKYKNIHAQKRKLKKLKLLQQSLARKKKGGTNRYRAKKEIANLHSKITNKRIDYLHQVSKAIVGKNHAMIAVEDLAVNNMIQNHKLARSISDVSWSTFTRLLEYKQRWKGGLFIIIDRFFPSSKTCSSCHYILPSLALSIREWICPSCEIVHDRDVNAAKNILEQARLSFDAESTESRIIAR